MTTAGGAVKCWGDNVYGQTTGDGKAGFRNTPVTVLTEGAALPPTVVTVRSRKTHGAAGSYDLLLAATPSDPTTEPRWGGAGGSGSVRVGFLAGDVNATRSVTLSDLLPVNARLTHTRPNSVHGGERQRPRPCHGRGYAGSPPDVSRSRSPGAIGSASFGIAAAIAASAARAREIPRDRRARSGATAPARRSRSP